jgi:hypothetical protein
VKKCFLISLVISAAVNVFAQTDSFDVFTCQPPEFFTKSVLSSEVHFNMTNKGGSFCTITLYESRPAKKDVMKDVISQWNEQVVKRLTKANKKPAQDNDRTILGRMGFHISHWQFLSKQKESCGDAEFF